MKVSVSMITYNHENFIAQALESALMQKVNFDYEIVIGEDCSTDSTRDIVIDFQKRYPEKIRLLLPEKNLGVTKNFVQTFQACKGQYIALLEGDDYWTSPYKLQKQVDFLDNHPECAICFHNATAFYEDGSRDSYNFNSTSQKEISTLDDLWTGCFIAGCSAMLRRGLIDRFPDWFYPLRWADWALYILYAHHGKIGYINEVMGAYRIHDRGLWSGLSEIRQLEEVIKFYENMNANLNFTDEKTIKTLISKHYYDLAIQHENNGDLTNARTYIIRCIIERPFNKYISGRELFKMLLRLYAPVLYKLIITSRRSIRSLICS